MGRMQYMIVEAEAVTSPDPRSLNNPVLPDMDLRAEYASYSYIVSDGLMPCPIMCLTCLKVDYRHTKPGYFCAAGLFA